MPAHAAAEAYSVLTRLPNPFRSSPSLVHSYLVGGFREQTLRIGASMVERIGERARLGVAGGAAYDELIGLTTLQHEATLLALDRRGVETNDRLGVRVRVLT